MHPRSPIPSSWSRGNAVRRSHIVRPPLAMVDNTMDNHRVGDGRRAESATTERSRLSLVRRSDERPRRSCRYCTEKYVYEVDDDVRIVDQVRCTTRVVPRTLLGDRNVEGRPDRLCELTDVLHQALSGPRIARSYISSPTDLGTSMVPTLDRTAPRDNPTGRAEKPTGSAAELITLGRWTSGAPWC